MSSLNSLGKYAILIITGILIATLLMNLILTRDTIVPPHIEPQTAAFSLPAVIYSFPFEDFTITFTSQIDPTVYFGAKAADKETIIRGNISDDIWLPRTYTAMVNDPAQDVFFTQLIDTFRSIRDKEHLNDDEYLELMTVMVQSIPYESISQNPPKFPIETYVDKSGDCDDKSLFLAGLLSREGYNVSLLSFSTESHMAVGVVCPGGEYKQTGYAFIETTNLSFVGVPTNHLRDGVVLLSNPLIIRVGNGTKIYGSCNESQYLDSFYDLSEKKVDELTGQIEALKSEMDGYYAQRDVQNYNQRVPTYNRFLQMRLRYAELHNYILDHQYDRKGTYVYVKGNLPDKGEVISLDPGN